MTREPLYDFFAKNIGRSVASMIDEREILDTTTLVIFENVSVGRCEIRISLSPVLALATVTRYPCLDWHGHHPGSAAIEATKSARMRAASPAYFSL
jgi:hypothetical protein